MEFEDAIEIVIELAMASVIDEDMVADSGPDAKREREEQKEAIYTVHDFVVNNILDETE